MYYDIMHYQIVIHSIVYFLCYYSSTRYPDKNISSLGPGQTIAYQTVNQSHYMRCINSIIKSIIHKAYLTSSILSISPIEVRGLQVKTCYVLVRHNIHITTCSTVPSIGSLLSR